jgi:hypothetical protein
VSGDVFIHLQSGGKKGTFLRGVAANFSEEAVIETVRAMLADPAAHNLSNVKPKTTFRGRKKQPALRGDEEEKIPGVLDETVERAFAE